MISECETPYITRHRRTEDVVGKLLASVAGFYRFSSHRQIPFATLSLKGERFFRKFITLILSFYPYFFKIMKHKIYFKSFNGAWGAHLISRFYDAELIITPKGMRILIALRLINSVCSSKVYHSRISKKHLLFSLKIPTDIQRRSLSHNLWNPPSNKYVESFSTTSRVQISSILLREAAYAEKSWGWEGCFYDSVIFSRCFQLYNT